MTEGPVKIVLMSPVTARPGRDRPRTAYVWPQSLLRAAGDVRIVYLDLNHWIELAKANTGHPDGVRFKGALQAIRSTGESFIFPLSSIHYMEMAGIRDPRQRLDVATVMEELSSFSCLANGATVMRLEIDAVLAQRLGRPEQLPPIPLLGRGVLQAFGRRGGLQVRTRDGQDATEAARRTWPQGPEAFDVWREEAERQLDRSVLRGPSDAEAPALHSLGWDPTAARRVATERAKQEAELDARLAAEPRWRRGRLRDVIAARYVAFEAMHALSEAVAQRGVTLPEVFGAEVTDARWFTDAMPSADVHISLLTAAHSNPQRRWLPNDIFDVDALSVAVAYADVVVTERHATHVLRSGGVAERLETNVVATLDELIQILSA